FASDEGIPSAWESAIPRLRHLALVLDPRPRHATAYIRLDRSIAIVSEMSEPVGDRGDAGNCLACELWGLLRREDGIAGGARYQDQAGGAVSSCISERSDRRRSQPPREARGAPGEEGEADKGSRWLHALAAMPVRGRRELGAKPPRARGLPLALPRLGRVLGTVVPGHRLPRRRGPRAWARRLRGLGRRRAGARAYQLVSYPPSAPGQC